MIRRRWLRKVRDEAIAILRQPTIPCHLLRIFPVNGTAGQGDLQER